MSEGKYIYVLDEDYDIFRKVAEKEHDAGADIEMFSATQNKWVTIKRSEFDKLFKHYPFVGGGEYYTAVAEKTVQKMIGVMLEYIKTHKAPVSWKNTAFKNVELW